MRLGVQGTHRMLYQCNKSGFSHPAYPHHPHQHQADGWAPIHKLESTHLYAGGAVLQVVKVDTRILCSSSTVGLRFQRMMVVVSRKVVDLGRTYDQNFPSGLLPCTNTQPHPCGWDGSAKEAGHTAGW